jgi:hypothetical protein
MKQSANSENDLIVFIVIDDSSLLVCITRIHSKWLLILSSMT